MLACYALNLWLVPASQAAFRAWQFEIRNQLAAILLQEGVFSSVGDDLTVYARYRDRDGTLRGILVHDARERGAPVTILAEAGRITRPKARASRWRTASGSRWNARRRPARPPARRPAPALGPLLQREQRRPGPRQPRRGEGDSATATPRNARIDELLHPDPADHVPDRDLRRFKAEAHQRLAGPLNAVGFALVALATGADRPVPPAWRRAAAVRRHRSWWWRCWRSG